MKKTRLGKVLAILAMTVTVGVTPFIIKENANAKEYCVKATNFEEMKVTPLTNMFQFDEKVETSWSHTWSLDKAHATQIVYAKFTLEKDCYVRIKMATENKGAAASKETVRIYGNKDMGVAIDQNDIRFGDGDDWLDLSAGTYYVFVRSQLYMKSDSKHVTTFKIGAIPQEKAVTYKATANTTYTKAKITVDQKMEETAILGFCEGTAVVGQDCKYTEMTGKTFTVEKNGWYTVKVHANSSVSFNQDIDVCKWIHVTCIDDVAPVVTGVTQGKIYKQAVTIKFSDRKSGIKSAKLNGNSVKNGVKVSKAGSYKLVVKDKAGNSTTVSFIIK